MSRPATPRGYLLDIEGVLVRDKRYEPVAGANEWFAALRESGLPFSLVSNNTTHTPAQLVADLNEAGFAVREEHLVGVPALSRRWLRERNKNRLMWLGAPNLTDYWREHGFELVEEGPCDAVVLGAASDLTIEALNRALAVLLKGSADLLCLHRNPFYLAEAGEPRLGPGAWAAALSAAADAANVITVGKPSQKIYNEALKRIGVAASEVLFISDDPVNDLVTARKMGMTTAFVLSGKYTDHGVLGRLAEQDWPHIISNSLGDLERPVPSA